MTDMMTFPETWEEFEKSYGFTDDEEVYTNGSRLIPSFRMKQWLDHIAHLESKRQATVSSNCIIRQDAKDVVDMELDAIDHVPEWVYDRLLTALDKVPSAQPKVNGVGDLISREYMKSLGGACIAQRLKDGDLCPIISIDLLPSVQLNRDIPKKPREIMDSTWGIHKKQAVCPKCDYYLGHVSFLGDYKGKRITYCETCGQAIDWEGWDFDD